jgi:DNA-directed RNA polymerase beta subunit
VNAPDEPEAPAGVKLLDPEDSDSLRGALESGVTEAMRRYVNGYSYGGVRLELAHLHIADKPKYTLAEQREALLNDRLLARRLRGDVRLVDETTNKVIDERKKLTLARLPYLTQRNTFISNGSEYAPVMQSRLLPGAYTRRRDSGDLEVHFNTRPGTGPAMRVTLDPATGQYRLKVGTSNLHAYSVFKDMGVTDEELEARWGKEILAANKAKYSKDAVARAYAKAIPKWQRDDSLDVAAKATALREALERAQVSETVLKQNLPTLYDRQKAAHWRKAGIAIDHGNAMLKQAGDKFAPDLSPEQVVDSWQELDFDTHAAMKSAGFDPDLAPDEMRESYNSIYGKHGPQLASMRRWPEHWLDDQDKQGWLEWYSNYAAGRRSEQDERQINRWLAFKRRHGAQFVSKPTPRRAYALRNWGIDPLKLLPEDSREEFEKVMDAYRGKEYVKWFMNRHDFDPESASKLVAKAALRGAVDIPEKPDAGALMRLAAEGFIKPEDLK